MDKRTGGRPETNGICSPVTTSPRLAPTRKSGKMKPPLNPERTVMLIANSFTTAMIAYQPTEEMYYLN